jgi:hypothetical protein
MSRHGDARFSQGHFRAGVQVSRQAGGRRRSGVSVSVVDLDARETEPLCERPAAARDRDGDGEGDEDDGGREATGARKRSGCT